MIHEPTNMEIKRLQYGKNVTVHRYCNIIGSGTVIGNNVKIGAYTEIFNAIIGDNVTIGMGCFIPEGVEIADNAWIGPRCVFTNDKYPPSPKEEWLPTYIGIGARLGAGVIVLPGVIIGEQALVGAGSIVTKSIPAGEIWLGVPASKTNRHIERHYANKSQEVGVWQVM